MAQTLGQLIADMLPVTQELRCPSCRGRVLGGVTIYAKVPVYAEKLGGSVRVRRHQKIIETKATLEDDIESLTDERDELYCENYDMRPGVGCKFWTTVAKIEGRE